MGDGTTKVELLMLNAPDGSNQPAHIHKGTCATLDPAPAYPLNNVQGGKSTTIVKVDLDVLTGDKYAINVHKSPTEASVYISCGNLPLASASSGTMTLDQVMSTLLDNANELLATVQKKEADGSANAYNVYHATFAAHENEIKAKDAGAQTEMDDAMTAVDTALKAGDWTKSATAASALVDKVKEIQDSLSSTTGNPTSAGLADAMTRLQTAAADVQRETTNADPEGAQNAYNDFHTLFAANEDAIKAKNADGQAHIETAMHEVNDAITAKDFKKAATAAHELVMEVNDASTEMGVTTGNLPSGGSPASPAALLALAAMAMVLVFTGGKLRRRNTV
jgi:hypothetical protein